MEDIYSILYAVACSGNKPMVLAINIKAEGSVYKKEGSSMLITGDGMRVGTLTAGCLEEDLSERAKQVWAAGKTWTVQYNMSEEHDLSWGQGQGCNGVITVLLEPVKEDFRLNLLLIKESLDIAVSVVGEMIHKMRSTGTVNV